MARAGLQGLAERDEPRALVAVVPVELAGPRAEVVARAEIRVPAVADSVGHSVAAGATIAVLGAQAAERGEPPAPAVRQEPP